MEVLKAVKARLNLAIKMIECGKTSEGMEVLKGWSAVFPDPDFRHVEAVSESLIKRSEKNAI